MPNWCDNVVFLEGKRCDIERLEEALSKKLKHKNCESKSWWFEFSEVTEENLEAYIDCADKFLFKRTLDYEDLAADVPKEEFGYDEHIEFIGTKWDPQFYIEVSPCPVREGEDKSEEWEEMELSFSSAWGPPLRAMPILGKKYNLNVDHAFNEPGADFGGRLTYDVETDEVRCGWTSYLNWMLLWCEHECNDVEDVMEYEGILDEEEKKEIREESKSWVKSEDEVMKMKLSYKDFLEKARNFG